jgi:t-SNARE complex subunit (syntaxin)
MKSYILDSLNSLDGTGRIEQLEAELENVRNAFEEYVSTTEGLEVDVKKEIREMRKSFYHPRKRNCHNIRNFSHDCFVLEIICLQKVK